MSVDELIKIFQENFKLDNSIKNQIVNASVNNIDWKKDINELTEEEWKCIFTTIIFTFTKIPLFSDRVLEIADSIKKEDDKNKIPELFNKKVKELINEYYWI